MRTYPLRQLSPLVLKKQTKIDPASPQTGKQTSNITHTRHCRVCYCTAPEPIRDDFLERLAKCQQETWGGKKIGRMSKREWKAKEEVLGGEVLISLQYLLDFGLVLKKNLEQGSRKGRVGQQWDGRGRTEEAWTRSHQNAPLQNLSALRQRLFLPCLFPCTIGLINIFRAAGLLRPVSICMTVGSGRRPFPRLTALNKKGQKIELSTILATGPTHPMWRLPVSKNTMVWAAMRAANMLLPGTPGAQKDTLIFVPPSSRPSFSRRASSAISAVANSNTANRRKLPSWPWANWREEHTKGADSLVPEKCRVPKCVDVWGEPELMRFQQPWNWVQLRSRQLVNLTPNKI